MKIDITSAAQGLSNQLADAKQLRAEIVKAVGDLNLAVERARAAGLIVQCSYGSSSIIDYTGKETKLDPAFHAYVSLPL